MFISVDYTKGDVLAVRNLCLDYRNPMSDLPITYTCLHHFGSDWQIMPERICRTSTTRHVIDRYTGIEVRFCCGAALNQRCSHALSFRNLVTMMLPGYDMPEWR